MSFTFNEWEVRNEIACPLCPHDPDEYLIGATLDLRFHQWAKTQSIPAPGIPDGIYSVDKVDTITEYMGDNGKWYKNEPQWPIEKDYEYRTALRLKSPLISGDREMQVDSKGESDPWISVEDSHPEIGHHVLVITSFLTNGKPDSHTLVGYKDEYGDLISAHDDENYGWEFNDCVTYWMPLPPPPKQD